MKLSVQCHELSSRLQTILTVVSARTTLPVLGNILLKADNDALALSATDLDLSIACSIPAQVAKPGSTTVPARMLAEIVRELTDESVNISVTNHRMEIKAGRGVYKLSGMSPEEFPRLPALPDTTPITIPADQLRMVVQKTAYAASTDDTRPALNGILWHSNGEGVYVVATDGHRLARVMLPANYLSGINRELIIPPKALGLVLKVVGESESDVRIQLGEKTVVFSIDNTVITSRLIEGPYPKYQQVIPKDNDKFLTVDSETLAQAVKRVAVLSNSLTHQVKFSVSQGAIELSATNQDVGGEARETVPCQYDKDDLEIGYNAVYILDILKSVGPGDVVFELATSVSAGLIHAADDQRKKEHLCLVMPLRLAD
ncbi:MAG TPA: DNA polymerase III subunit beta [candidate division Zixibacteria bacterium]|jgi:DNA polymerase-3 subunit beta